MYCVKVGLMASSIQDGCHVMARPSVTMPNASDHIPNPKTNYLNYELNQCKQLTKKRDRLDGEDISVSHTGGGVVLEFSTLFYEAFKGKTMGVVKNDSKCSVDVHHNSDCKGMQVHSTLKVKSKGRNSKPKADYILNFYNTTNKVLVNGTGASKFLREVVPKVVSQCKDVLNSVNMTKYKRELRCKIDEALQGHTATGKNQIPPSNSGHSMGIQQGGDTLQGLTADQHSNADSQSTITPDTDTTNHRYHSTVATYRQQGNVHPTSPPTPALVNNLVTAGSQILTAPAQVAPPVSIVDLTLDPNRPVPCGVCEVDVTNETDGIQCDNCNEWFHFGCEQISTQQRAILQGHETTDVPYNCKKCNFVLISARESSQAENKDRNEQRPITKSPTAQGPERHGSHSKHGQSQGDGAPASDVRNTDVSKEEKKLKDLESKLRKREEAIKAREVKVKFQEDQNALLRTNLAKLQSTSSQQAETIRLLQLQSNACRCGLQPNPAPSPAQVPTFHVPPTPNFVSQDDTTHAMLKERIRAEEMASLQERLHDLRFKQLENRISEMENRIEQPGKNLDLTQLRPLLNNLLVKLNDQSECIENQKRTIDKLQRQNSDLSNLVHELTNSEEPLERGARSGGRSNYTKYRSRSPARSRSRNRRRRSKSTHRSHNADAPHTSKPRSRSRCRSKQPSRSNTKSRTRSSSRHRSRHPSRPYFGPENHQKVKSQNRDQNGHKDKTDSEQGPFLESSRL